MEIVRKEYSYPSVTGEAGPLPTAELRLLFRAFTAWLNSVKDMRNLQLLFAMPASLSL